MRTSAAEICPICTDFTAVYENSSGFYIDPYIYGAIALPPKVELGLGYDNYYLHKAECPLFLLALFVPPCLSFWQACCMLHVAKVLTEFPRRDGDMA